MNARTRIVIGALAGMAATLAMTSLMERLYERLPEPERYPLTPREIAERVGGSSAEGMTATRTLAAHFAYGAVTGAMYGYFARRWSILSGAAYGLTVWFASYLGWIPSAKILRPANHHPWRRNVLMLIAHVVWGAATALGIAELRRAHGGAFAGGVLRDAHPTSVAPSITVTLPTSRYLH